MKRWIEKLSLNRNDILVIRCSSNEGAQKAQREMSNFAKQHGRRIPFIAHGPNYKFTKVTRIQLPPVKK